MLMFRQVNQIDVSEQMTNCKFMKGEILNQ